MNDHSEAMRRAFDTALTDSDRRAADGNKIAMIKMIRIATQWGLKDSKDFVDAYLGQPRPQYSVASLIGRIVKTRGDFSATVYFGRDRFHLALVSREPGDYVIREWPTDDLLDAVNREDPYFTVEA